ncbi:putative Trypsin-7 [Daphnia magna]|uniref:Putative Trypsin-7 n=1 Tax=Daphnia magna TaxID=35525 RepID=A0A164PEX7_9CRUS|nr:putative Trypsin-7 [Daphnia magna]
MSRQKPKLLIRELLVATPTHRPSLLDGEERSQVEFLSLFICGNISPFLLKANVTVLDNSVCTRQYNTSFILTIMMCASAPGKDTYQNDSGGPLYVNGIQVGITSWGFGCADPNFAGIYARVTTYVDWIAKTVANNPA